MQTRQLLRVILLLMLCAARTASQLADRGSQVTVSTSARNIVDSDKGGHFNVYFIPAYRLSTNRTLTGGSAHPGAGPSGPGPAQHENEAQRRAPLDARDARVLAARLVGAALHAVVRNATASELLRLRAESDDKPPRSAKLVEPPSQHHDAHILVTVQRPQPGAGVTTPATRSPSAAHLPGHLPLLPVGLGTAHIYNNYPAVQGHVPAHYGVANLPHYYFGHLPAPAGGLLAQQSGLVAVSPGTLLGTTGPVYASPGRPASTLLHPLPSTTPAPAPTSVTSSATTTASGQREKEDGDDDRRPERSQTFEIIKTTNSDRLNLSEEVEVTGPGVERGTSGRTTAEETTPRPPGTQETSSTTATETTDLNNPSLQSQPPATQPNLQPQAPQSQPLPNTHSQLPPPPPSFLPYPSPTFPNPGFVFGGYSSTPGDYDARYNIPVSPSVTRVPQQSVNNDPYRGVTPSHQPPAPHLRQQVNRNPPYSNNNYNPFYDPGYIPGFAPGYPFGAPTGGHADPNIYRRPTAQPVRPAVGVFDRFPTGAGAPGGTGVGVSQENSSQEGGDVRPAPVKFQAGTGSAEDFSAGFQRQQPQYTGFSNVPYTQPFPQQKLQVQQPYQVQRQPQRLQLQQQQLQEQQLQQQQQQQPIPPSGYGPTTPNPYFRPFNQPTQPFGLHPQYHQFADQFLAPGRGQQQPSFYTGALPNQQSLQGVSDPTRQPAPSPSSTDPDLTPLFNPQQYRPPFGFPGNPFDQSDPEARQSQIVPRTAVRPSPRKLVSVKIDVNSNHAENDALGSEAKPKRLSKWEDAAMHHNS